MAMLTLFRVNWSLYSRQLGLCAGIWGLKCFPMHFRARIWRQKWNKNHILLSHSATAGEVCKSKQFKISWGSRGILTHLEVPGVIFHVILSQEDLILVQPEEGGTSTLSCPVTLYCDIRDFFTYMWKYVSSLLDYEKCFSASCTYLSSILGRSVTLEWKTCDLFIFLNLYILFLSFGDAILSYI